LEHLVKYAENIDAKNKRGKTALQLANQGNHCECIEILLKKKAVLQKETYRPLHAAALIGSPSFLSFLLKGANAEVKINEKDEFGRTALHIASKENSRKCMITMLDQKEFPVSVMKQICTDKLPCTWPQKKAIWNV
jgi:ankyrin repeat protein